MHDNKNFELMINCFDSKVADETLNKFAETIGYDACREMLLNALITKQTPTFYYCLAYLMQKQY